VLLAELDEGPYALVHRDKFGRAGQFRLAPPVQVAADARDTVHGDVETEVEGHAAPRVGVGAVGDGRRFDLFPAVATGGRGERCLSCGFRGSGGGLRAGPRRFLTHG
jgi:hypothetical protein